MRSMHAQMLQCVKPSFTPVPPPQVRTQTLVKNAIIQIDATPFKQWYQTHYGVELGNKGKTEPVAATVSAEPLHSMHA